jgi:hypothetical protein
MIWNWLRSLFANREERLPEPEPDPLVENRARAVQRARLMTQLPTRYVLGAGGRDPKADTPLTKRDGVLGSDCIGLTCWALGHDRYQPGSFDFYSGWINTDSMMMDARRDCTWYAPTAMPVPGDVVVFPSIIADGVRQRIGHIGLIVEVPDDLPPDVWSEPAASRRAWLQRIKVIDCASSAARRNRGHAVAETTAAASWDKPDAMFCRLVREV